MSAMIEIRETKLRSGFKETQERVLYREIREEEFRLGRRRRRHRRGRRCRSRLVKPSERLVVAVFAVHALTVEERVHCGRRALDGGHGLGKGQREGVGELDEVFGGR